MSWIMSLTKFILVPVITEWSKCDDILMLDTALCNHTDRQYYQSLMSEYSEKYLRVLLDGLKVDLSPRLCDWIAVRFPLVSAVRRVPMKLIVQPRTLQVYSSLDNATKNKVSSFLAPVENLEIIRCDTDNQDLCESLFPHLHNVVKFSVSIDCWSYNTVLEPSTLEAAARHFSNLRVFHLYGCRHVSDKMLSAFVRQCKQLSELSIEGCTSLNGDFLLTLIATRSPVKVLELFGAYEPELLKYLLHAKVEELYYRNATSLINRTLIWYSRYQLRAVYIMWTGEVLFSQLVDEIVECCQSLTKFEMVCINRFNDVQLLMHLASSWKLLIVLKVDIASEVSLSIVKCVCNACAILQDLTLICYGNQKYMTISDCQYVCRDLMNLTLYGSLSDEMYLSILSQSRKFRKLDIPGWYPSIENIALVVPYLRNLEELYMQSLPQESFNCILRNCSNLKELYVPLDLTIPTDGSVFLPSMATLHVQGLERVWLVCPNLKELFASDITQALAKLLVEHLPRLRVLHCGVKDWRSKECIQNSKLKIN